MLRIFFLFFLFLRVCNYILSLRTRLLCLFYVVAVLTKVYRLRSILRALVPLAYHILSPAIEGNGFPELMNIMSTLADAGSEKGHSLLFKAAIEWVELW